MARARPHEAQRAQPAARAACHATNVPPPRGGLEQRTPPEWPPVRPLALVGAAVAPLAPPLAVPLAISPRAAVQLLLRGRRQQRVLLRGPQLPLAVVEPLLPLAHVDAAVGGPARAVAWLGLGLGLESELGFGLGFGLGLELGLGLGLANR